MPGQLASLAGLCPLRHLDLQLVGVDEILRRHAETRRGHLLDLRAQRIAFAQRDVGDDALDARGQRLARLHGRIATRVLAAFAGVRLAADPIHRHGERRVRFGRDRAQAHRARREALDDLGRGFDFLERHGLARMAEFEEPAQRQHALRLVVDQRRVFLVRLRAPGARCVLQLGDRVRRPHVVFAADAIVVLATDVERVAQQRRIAECRPMQPRRFLGDLEQADALDVACGAGEIFFDELALQAHSLEDLRAAVRLVRRDAHLGHHLVEPLRNRLDVLVGGILRRRARPELGLRSKRLQREVRMDRLGAVPGEQREMMDLARRPGLDDEAGARAQALAHEMLMHGRRREQRRDRHQLG